MEKGHGKGNGVLEKKNETWDMIMFPNERKQLVVSGCLRRR